MWIKTAELHFMSWLERGKWSFDDASQFKLCRTYSTLYTVWYNTLHRFLDGRIPQVRIPHILRGEVPPGIYLGRWNRFIHGHPSSSGHIGDTDYIQIQVTQSKHIITRQKYGIVKAEYYVGWHRGVYTFLHTHLSQAFIKPPVTYPAQWYVSTIQYKSLHKM